ncbi:MAG TPA: alpha/beta hydrolase-fold protein [Lentimicrobium sp.]|nr:alpha/beta hydrolase-fold protein [Lentimicrobium sp.]
MKAPARCFYLLSLALIPMSFSGCDRTREHDEPVPAFERLQTGQSVNSSILKRPIGYAVLLPAEYENTTKSYPVVYLLHGFGDNEKAWYQGGNIRYHADLYAAETGPVIYVMPQGFNTYWVNKYNGNYPFMDMLTQELMPHIDSLYRTEGHASQRAVMGYSMGGYGALILAAKNPELFGTAVVLSMSFRTDEQYLAEPQSVYDVQWGPVFGSPGKSGNDRLSPYFLEYSPFHFFTNPNDPALSGQRYFIDCGDDEESLSETNNALHLILRQENINHEYRVRNGAHTWDYWHKSLPEAFRFMGAAFRNQNYPGEGEPAPLTATLSHGDVHDFTISGTAQPYRVLTPEGYALETRTYPLFVFLHDRPLNDPEGASENLLALMKGNILGMRLPQSLFVEIPYTGSTLSANDIIQLTEEIKQNFRVNTGGRYAVIGANGNAGSSLTGMAGSLSEIFTACMLFDAGFDCSVLPESKELKWYLDITDEGTNALAYHTLFMHLKKGNFPHEYRVRQGLATHSDFLSGINNATVFIKDNLLKQ